MPKTTRDGQAKQSELPDTLKRSPAKAQRTFAKAHDAAVEQYGEGERAHRTAMAALKHTVPGDFCVVSRAELDAVLSGQGMRLRR